MTLACSDIRCDVAFSTIMMMMLVQMDERIRVPVAGKEMQKKFRVGLSEHTVSHFCLVWDDEARNFCFRPHRSRQKLLDFRAKFRNPDSLCDLLRSITSAKMPKSSSSRTHPEIPNPITISRHHTYLSPWPLIRLLIDFQWPLQTKHLAFARLASPIWPLMRQSIKELMMLTLPRPFQKTTRYVPSVKTCGSKARRI